MDENRIQDAIRFLDAEVPRQHAKVKLEQYGGGPDESRMIANKLGFLRFGIEFLKAAHARPSDQQSNIVDIELDYLLTTDSSISFDWFERREPDADEQQGRVPSSLITAFIVSCVALAFLLMVVGLIAAVKWIVAIAS